MLLESINQDLFIKKLSQNSTIKSIVKKQKEIGISTTLSTGGCQQKVSGWVKRGDVREAITVKMVEPSLLVVRETVLVLFP